MPQYDFQAFGDSVLKLASDASLRRELAERGRAVVRERFSLDKSMRNVVDDIQRLVRH